MGCGTIIATLLDSGGAAVDAYGGYEGSHANYDTGKAENLVAGQDISAMNQFGQNAMSKFNQNLANSTPQAANADLMAGQQQFTSAANTTDQAQPGFASPLNQKSQAASNAKAQMGAKAMGGLAGYSNIPLQMGLGNQYTNSQIGLINQLAQQRQSIMPGLMQLAASGNQSTLARGQLFEGLGKLLFGAGGMFRGSGNGGGIANGGGLQSSLSMPSFDSSANDGQGPLWMQGAMQQNQL